MNPFLRLMRPHHWIKNGLIFLPLLFSGRLLESSLALRNVGGFLTFSLGASLVYVVNDLYDRDRDRNHPLKAHRPLASGAVSPGQAKLLIGLLLLAVILLQGLLLSGPSWMLLASYLGINYGYSRGLKHIPLLDVAILVSGFLIRVLYGAVLSQIEVSPWLYLTVMALSFYLGLGKRRNEISYGGSDSRQVLKYYNYNFLDKNMYLCLALTIVFYALWTVDPATVARYGTQALVWTVPLALLICMKYSLNVEKTGHGDPVDIVFGDPLLLALIGGFLLLLSALVYGVGR